MVKVPREAPDAGPIRPLNLPAPVDVEEDERQRPVAVTVRGRWLTVASIDDVWEISDEWWRTEPLARTYYVVTTQDGAVATIYRDMVTGAWYAQRG